MGMSLRIMVVGTCCIVSAVAALLADPVAPLSAQQARDEVKIGMMNNLFEEQDEKKIRVQIEPFAALVRRQTGTKGDFVVVNGRERMVEDLKANRVQMGVMHGLDYAWIRDQLMETRPLLIAVADTTTLKAALVVPKDSSVQSVADLKKQTLALNAYPPYHVRYWLNHICDGDYAGFFKVVTQRDVEAAMEEVADKSAAATAVSNGALEFYKRQKPVRFQRFFRVLMESPDFPAPVMIYRTGQVRPELVQRFRTSMLSAHETPEGRDTLQLWRLKRFLDVPADYDRLAEETAKRFPPPSEPARPKP
ncbi:MAG: phosphate/phosphite/phosphonate ABC transporter substrate-binding protein [Gemmatales bacterium]|nr:phosphate/phosphite/phosphonate ABC transporter substrate-binding protein [Gemmatales bacterium]MDW8387504.1 PhnD/SsuA/transferrin family substrate-binding protein [Gemmatales bacterium]